jgi:nitroimidazol reductase NimA-like FMN-containing flavoprotein (pyridoxamine 5'-phosphate oxidase superfamily)
MAQETPAPSAQTIVKRHRERGRYDRDLIEQILDEALICHLGFVHDGQPFVIPTIHARRDDIIYVHGSPASRMLRHLKEGEEAACLTVTVVDGLVLARSAFNHSMNYRSVVVLGTLREVTDRDEKMIASEAITEHVTPGRWASIRWPSDEEFRKTTILALELDQASAKVRTGPPVDAEEDYELSVWAGVLPIGLGPSAPVPDPRMPEGTPVPDHVRDWDRTNKHPEIEGDVG